MANTPTDTDKLARIVMLVFGKMQDSQGSYWCYVAIKPSEYQRFMQLHQSGKVNLYDLEKEGFGEIIVSGQGRQPPKEITYQVAQIYKLEIDELFQESDGIQALEKKILPFNEPENS